MTKTAGSPTADSPLTAAPPGVLRALCNGVFFLVACAAGCALLGRLAPFPEVPGIFPKWEYFQKNRDRFDVLFIGSSRFYHQIIPQQFDSATGSTHSFNFAYDGMWPPESYYLLRRLLALRPARLKWVVVDLMDINTQLDERNNSTLRMAYWHDLRHTGLAFRDIIESKFHWNQKFDLLAQHGRLACSQILNLGRGAELLNKQLIVNPWPKKIPSWANTAGYEPGPARGMEGKLRDGFVLTVDRLKSELPEYPVRPVFRDALHALIADIRRAGAEPIFVIAPTINSRENFTEIPDGAMVIPLNKPAEHPELFDPAKHYDAWHLNPQGAVDFTTLLSEKFVEKTTAKKP